MMRVSSTANNWPAGGKCRTVSDGLTNEAFAELATPHVFGSLVSSSDFVQHFPFSLVSIGTNSHLFTIPRRSAVHVSSHMRKQLCKHPT